jgi:hypothetical protein
MTELTAVGLKAENFLPRTVGFIQQLFRHLSRIPRVLNARTYTGYTMQGRRKLRPSIAHVQVHSAGCRMSCHAQKRMAFYVLYLAYQCAINSIAKE